MRSATINPPVTVSPSEWGPEPIDLTKPTFVRLRDGPKGRVREPPQQDEPALHSFLSGLCLEARRMRFFTGAADMNYAARLGVAMGEDRCGLVAHDEAG